MLWSVARGVRGAGTAREYMVRPWPPRYPQSEIRDANTRYHDVAAGHYDSKWGIDFGEVGAGQVSSKVRKALGGGAGALRARARDRGGTGYFTLNLMRAGLDRPGDVQRHLARDARARFPRMPRGWASRCSPGLRDAERLPFDDESFDLVFGHAILHHIPDLPRAFAEFKRVLAPGGTVLFAGEPSRYGDRLAGYPKRLAGAIAPLWRRAVRVRGAAQGDGDEEEESLERIVDVHAFAPGELEAAASGAGFTDVRVAGEELLANWFGWTNRTLEATADPHDIPWAWRQYAYRGYLMLQRVDQGLLESRLPAAIFYNLLLSARKAG